jgi:decaprenyl-phosphate phosphoribosyltransferase
VFVHLVRLMRPRQWVKNALVALPVVLDRSTAIGWSALGACVVTTVAAAAVYVLNDIRDRDRDRLHPAKCARPLASGQVSLCAGTALLLTLLALVAVGTVLMPSAAVWLAVYMAIQVSYSLGAKHVPALEVIAVASGYPLRILLGMSVTGAAFSLPLLIVAGMGAIALVAGKRAREKEHPGKHREVLRAYSLRWLNRTAHMCWAGAIAGTAYWALMDINLFKILTLVAGSMAAVMAARSPHAGEPERLATDPKIALAVAVAAAGAFFGG